MIASRLARLVLASLVAIGALAGGLPGTAPRDVRAATPDLTIVSDARYDVQPAQHRVRVTLDLTLTNRLHDTKTKRYFFDHAFLAVLPGATGYSASWAGRGRPTVSVARRTSSYTLLRLNLAQDLSSGKTARYRLAFDLRDPGGKATRDLRIGDTLVSFPVWAFASDGTPGSSVTVVFPKGYDIAVEAGHIATPTTLPDGRTIFRTGPLSVPLDFFAYLVGDRPGAYRDTTITPTVVGRQVAVTVRSWSDDVSECRRHAVKEFCWNCFCRGCAVPIAQVFGFLLRGQFLLDVRSRSERTTDRLMHLNRAERFFSLRQISFELLDAVPGDLQLCS